MGKFERVAVFSFQREMRLEKRLTRWPRLKRPEGWEPRFGERVWFAPGDQHRLTIVRVRLGREGDRFPISIRASTCGAQMYGTAPLSRLWPVLGWEEERARLEAEI